MENTTLFDVLIVYNHTIATSASLTGPDTELPFSKASKRTSYNNSYAYFLEAFAKNNLKTAFTTTADLTKEGNFKSYWLYKDNKWSKVNKPCFSELIFDKFSPTSEEQKKNRDILFSNPKIKPFNDPRLALLFADKLKTYEELRSFSIPSVAIEEGSKEGIDRAIATLRTLIRNNPSSNDFSERIVLKDRFGAGGNNIFCISSDNQEAEILNHMQKNKDILFILQPFVKYDKGFSYRGHTGFTDIRLIFLKGEVIQTYIRMAKEGDFRCNQHQGGSINYISKEELPEKVLEVAGKIVDALNEKTSLYALDFIISNSGNVYLMEGNNGPGVSWNPDDKEDVRRAKELMTLIVQAIAERVKDGK